MCIVTLEEGSTARLCVEGDVDAATAHDLAAAIDEAFAAGADRIVVDLARTEFIDTVGVTVLHDAALRYGHATISVFCPHVVMRRVFEIIGLHLFVDIVNAG
jgi:anti-anti-sigma factor